MRRRDALASSCAPDLAQLALDPVAHDRVARRLRHREAEPRLARLRPRAGTSRASGSASRPSGRGGRRRRSPASGRGGAGAARRAADRLGREALAPLGAAALEDRAAGARRHARTEAVLALPPAHVWLVGPLHSLEKSRRERRFSPEPGGQYRRAPLRRRCPQALRGRRKAAATGLPVGDRPSPGALSTPVESMWSEQKSLQIGSFFSAHGSPDRVERRCRHAAMLAARHRDGGGARRAAWSTPSS